MSRGVISLRFNGPTTRLLDRVFGLSLQPLPNPQRATAVSSAVPSEAHRLGSRWPR